MKIQVKKINKKISRIVRLFQKESDNHLYKNYPRESLQSKQFYNIGSGNFYHKYWTNIDYSLAPYRQQQNAPFININLMEAPELPIKTDSAELFYTSHTIEHITDIAVSKLFSECYRALKPKGIFRIICPDADLLYKTIQLSRIEYWHWRYSVFAKYTDNLDQITLEDFVVRELATERCRFFNTQGINLLSPDIVRKKFYELDKISFFNFIVSKCSFSEERANWHINWWNEEKLSSFLKKAGFDTIIRSGYEQSLAAPFHNTEKFDNRCPKISIYIEAIK